MIEIKPCYRNKGRFYLLFQKSLAHLKKQLAAKVSFVGIREESKKFCEKLGFTTDNDLIVKSNNSFLIKIG